MLEDEAELLGMHVGDGTLYRTNRGVVWELRGALAEKEYYDYHIRYLLEKLFEVKFKPKYRSGGKNGCYGIQSITKSLKAGDVFFVLLPRWHNLVLRGPKGCKIARPVRAMIPFLARDSAKLRFAGFASLRSANFPGSNSFIKQRQIG